MFGLQPLHLLIILIVALIIFGPNQLLKIARALGETLREFRKATAEAQTPIQEAAQAVRDALSEPPLLVFVSSIMNPQCDDLTAERAAAKKAIEGFPSLTRAWRFEDSPASPESASWVYLKKVEQCDIFVLVLGKEITRPVIREYWRARKHEKPCLAFLKKCERAPAAQKFVEIIRGEVKYAEFSQANDLDRQIWQAVGALLIDGVRRYKLSANDMIVLTAFLNQLPKIETLITPAETSATHVDAEPRIQVSEQGSTRFLAELALPAPSGKITFTVRKGNHSQDQTIYIMNTDGSSVTAILDRASDPAFSPDGTKIAYYGWTSGIYVAGSDLSPRKVIDGTDLGFPSWSHDGRWLAFSTRHRSEGRIEAVALDGSGRRYIANGWAPAWSPNDTEIVFQSCLDGVCGIYRLHLADAKITPITMHGGELPSWSRRGDKIVYQNEVEGERQLFVINIDGSDKKQLTFDSVHSSATWSWDGNFIFYRSTEGGSWGIWRMRCDGTSPIKLIDNMPPGDLLYDRISYAR